MCIVIDGIVFSLQKHGGISVYFQQLVARLRRDTVRSCLTLDGPALQGVPAAGGALTVVRRASRLAERYRSARMIPGGTLFHSSYYRLPGRPRLPSVVTVHDFTYERSVRGPRRWVHSAQKFAAIRAAQAVICVSDATRLDLLELVGVRPSQRVCVIHNGVDEGFRPEDHPAAARPFVLFVGQRAGYKNFRLVAEALTLLPDIELSCVGGGPLRRDELDGLPEATRARIRHLGFIDNRDLNRLYNQALCLAYPSSYEGFGIPVVEAMRAGCPVVCIACKAVVEVGRYALAIAEPEPASLAEQITLVASPGVRDGLIRAGLDVARNYAWERTYRETLEVYRAVAAQ
jgi:mannosyltransferase